MNIRSHHRWACKRVWRPDGAHAKHENAANDSMGRGGCWRRLFRHLSRNLNDIVGNVSRRTR